MEGLSFDYQDSHVKNIVDGFVGNNLVIDESQSGSGKTHSSAKVAKQMGLHAFVLSVKKQIPFWIVVLRRYGLTFDVVNYEMFKSGFIYEARNKQTCSYEKVRFQGFRKSTIVIIDEVHVCKNDETGNATMLKKILDTKIKTLGLSATLKDKKNKLPPYKSFSMEVNYNFANNVTFTQTYKNARIPNFNFTAVRLLEKSKIPMYLEYFEKRTSNNVIIFANYNETIKILADELREHNPIVVNGAVENNRAQSLLGQFKKKGGLLIINSMIGGQSLNLQDDVGDKPRFVIANLIWSGTRFKQLLYRTSRVDSKSETNQIILVSDHPLDAYMYCVLTKKLRFMEKCRLDNLNKFGTSSSDEIDDDDDLAFLDD